MTTPIWNVRGVRRKALFTNLQFLLQKHHPKMIALLETKVTSVDTNCSFKLLCQTLPMHIIIPGTGNSGGLRIWICWDPLSISVEVMHESNQHVTLSCFFTGNNSSRAAHCCLHLPKLTSVSPAVGVFVFFLSSKKTYPHPHSLALDWGLQLHY